MTSTFEIKKEEQPIPLQLYTIAPSSPSDWSPNIKISVPQPPVPQPICTSYPEVPLAKTVRGPYRHDQSSALYQPERPLLSATQLGSPFMGSAATPRFAYTIPPSSSNDPPCRPRVPRPPNAFMLFRSDFLKRGVIPDFVERRQQNLSRIAGQVWNMLGPEEKAKWHEQAALVLSQHQQKNPDYKFTPAPRGSRHSKSKARDDSASMADEEVRRIRETYANVMGPSPTSNRKRRQKKARSVEVADRFPVAVFPTGTTADSFYSPCASSSSPFRPPLQADQFQRFYPLETFPHAILPRRPSTSLGFNEHPKKEAMASGEHDDARSILSRPPSPAASSSGFLGFIRNRFQDIVGGDSAASTSSSAHPQEYPSWDGFKISPTQLTVPSSPIHPQLAGPSTPQPTSNSYCIPAEDTDPTVLGFVEATRHGAAPYQPNNNEDSSIFFGSLGFSDDMMSYLKPPYDTPLFSSEDSKHEVWLSGSNNFEKWDFQDDLYTVSNVNFSMADSKDST